jgi:hypothetical protein
MAEASDMILIPIEIIEKYAGIMKMPTDIMIMSSGITIMSSGITTMPSDIVTMPMGILAVSLGISGVPMGSAGMTHGSAEMTIGLVGMSMGITQRSRGETTSPAHNIFHLPAAGLDSTGHEVSTGSGSDRVSFHGTVEFARPRTRSLSLPVLTSSLNACTLRFEILVDLRKIKT